MIIYHQAANHSLKSTLVFSHPKGVGSKAATFSVNWTFRVRDLSVHNSYMVVKLKRRVCEVLPESTKLSSRFVP